MLYQFFIFHEILISKQYYMEIDVGIQHYNINVHKVEKKIDVSNNHIHI